MIGAKRGGGKGGETFQPLLICPFTLSIQERKRKGGTHLDTSGLISFLRHHFEKKKGVGGNWII